MLLQELLPELKCLIRRSNYLDLILKIGYPPDYLAILIGVDTLEMADD
jgi:hypothetical protein